VKREAEEDWGEGALAMTVAQVASKAVCFSSVPRHQQDNEAADEGASTEGADTEP
jgi:hypothetical protein